MADVVCTGRDASRATELCPLPEKEIRLYKCSYLLHNQAKSRDIFYFAVVKVIFIFKPDSKRILYALFEASTVEKIPNDSLINQRP